MANKVKYGGKTYDLDTPAGRAAFDRASNTTSVSSETRQDIADQEYAKQFGGGMSAAELQDFESLIGRLEGSKMRQAAQGNRARQRDTFAAGLAGMMGNF
jgi:hypothetical protein